MCIKFNEIEVKRIKFYSFVMFAVTQSLLVVILSSSSQPKPKPNKQTTQDISFEPNNQQWFVDWTEWADAMINKHHEMIFNGFRKREKNCIKHHFRSVSFVSFHFFHLVSMDDYRFDCVLKEESLCWFFQIECSSQCIVVHSAVCVLKSSLKA